MYALYVLVQNASIQNVCQLLLDLESRPTKQSAVGLILSSGPWVTSIQL
jgi:hypothetical protein